ncbi:hypothetical protein AJ78_00571 [Emergomyces pasteurianus Ep9510]|uniref:Autophagy-related protein 29 n=1 Tax=Emergomyces pasteurianus Ep9510 TaxID=1447872 RepID=A0A1J9PTA3_9EURO|nr:hypothetical protein AJ78_00571 [Emergomyces pasteurianus Ep9510]
MSPQPSELDPHFTVFIRLPFPRGNFVDPPTVEWSVAKDHALWDILSRPSKGNDIDCPAEHFDVTLPFLLQQAAWLYDRQLSQVRAQIRKVGNPHSAANSPVPQSMSGSGAIGGQPMKRGGSNASRDPSRLSMRQKEGQAVKQESSEPPTPIKSKAPLYPNISSANPPIQATAVRPQSPRLVAPPHTDSISRNQPNVKKESRTVSSPLTSPPLGQNISEPASSSSSSSSDSAEEDVTRRGPPFIRFGRFSAHRGSNSIDDEEDSPAFLPLSTHHRSSTEQTGHDPSATLRREPELAGRPHPRLVETATALAKTSATESSTSSGSSGPASGTAANERIRPTLHPITLSPRRAAELARLSPRRRAGGREGSDGTPSMGSSFSDLDDASLTQSALEEALLSTMQRGGVASRMSTISQALKSKYL